MTKTKNRFDQMFTENDQNVLEIAIRYGCVAYAKRLLKSIRSGDEVRAGLEIENLNTLWSLLKEINFRND